jgi:hypothetical protein
MRAGRRYELPPLFEILFGIYFRPDWAHYGRAASLRDFSTGWRALTAPLEPVDRFGGGPLSLLAEKLGSTMGRKSERLLNKGNSISCAVFPLNGGPQCGSSGAYCRIIHRVESSGEIVGGHFSLVERLRPDAKRHDTARPERLVAEKGTDSRRPAGTQRRPNCTRTAVVHGGMHQRQETVVRRTGNEVKVLGCGDLVKRPADRGEQSALAG